MRKFAEAVGIGAAYQSDIEYGGRTAPENDILDNIIKALRLTPDEERFAYDLAASERGERTIAQDIPNYIRENPIVIRALRTAKDAGVGVKEWEAFIEECITKNKQ
jgi:transcriptional regulator with XRE-family HTH domain